MSPVAETLITSLTKGLSGSLLKAAGRRLRRRLEDPERFQALERSCQAGVVAMVGASRTERDSERQLLDDIFREFFTGEETRDDVGTEIAQLLRGHRLDGEAIEELFAAAGFEAEKLPGVDFGRALHAFEGAFITAAVEETALQGEIEIGVLMHQLEVLREMRADLRELVRFLTRVRPGTIEVRANHVEAMTLDGTVAAFELLPPPPPPTPLRPYLEHLMGQAGRLTLSGVDPAVRRRNDTALELDAVYTALLTSGADRLRSPAEAVEREPSAVAALEQLNRHPRLVLLGEPGSGKSTFVNFLSLTMAGALTGSERIGLGLLTAPLPDEDGSDQEEDQVWDHGALLPLRLVLRDFAARGLPPSGAPGNASHLWSFVTSELDKAALGELAEPLKEALRDRGGLVLFDGLDEVPEAEGRREQILQAISDFVEAFGRCRFLVTCRTYAYQHQRWRLPGFETALLLPLSAGQIRRFIRRWYDHIAVLRHLDPADARGRGALLEAAIFRSDRLRSLAERPLLLTLMASLHAWREGSLPERREELYADAVELLLDFWERKRVVLGPTGEPVVQQPSLAEWLRVDRAGVRRLLHELAFNAHDQQAELVGTADIPQSDLVDGLLDIAGNPDARPGRLLEYLRDRAGLLLERAPKVYTFPHRTFQEYLAACHLTGPDFPDRVANLARSDPERWREVALLAGAKAAQGTPGPVWQLAEALCYREVEASDGQAADAHGAYLAGLLLSEAADLEHLAARHREKLERVRSWQLALLRGTELQARERAECGRSLARLGELRREVLAVAGMEFCRVPAGPFLMGGEESPAEEVELPEGYWIARFPVTQAQFAAFVEAGGYGEERFWREAQAAGVWEDGALRLGGDPLRGPRELGGAFSLPNHPVVGVSWYEATAFCRWLGEHFLTQARLPPGWELRLPREAEWEKAARGGLEVPPSPEVTSLLTGSGTEPEGIPNRRPERLYPWGDEIDGELANYAETAIGSTSAVGCFAAGASPYGCEEMSGNVWEWCEDKYEVPWGKDEPWKVLRGGGWADPAEYLRAAFRYWFPASLRYVSVGFRVLAVPASLAS